MVKVLLLIHKRDIAIEEPKSLVSGQGKQKSTNSLVIILLGT